MIATDLQPFNVVNTTGFRNLLSVMDPCYQIPDRNKLANDMLPDIYHSISEKMLSVLNKVEYVSITTDMWTSVATEFYITITTHFKDNGWKLGSCVVCTSVMKERHTAENISASLLKCF